MGHDAGAANHECGITDIIQSNESFHITNPENITDGTTSNMNTLTTMKLNEECTQAVQSPGGPLPTLYDNLYMDIKNLSQNGISIAAVNVRSLLPKFEEICILLTKSKLDLLCICETWLDSSVSDSDIALDGYTVIRDDRNRHGGGTLIYVKTGLNFEVLCCNRQCDIEAVFLKFSAKHPFIVGSLYRPPSATSMYYDALLDCIEELKQGCNDIILLGDLNYDCSMSLHDSVGYIESAFDLKQIVESNTRVTQSSSTLIDIILTSMPQNHIHTDVLHTTFSDHYMVYTIIGTTMKPVQQHKNVTYNDYKNFNATTYLNDVQRNVNFRPTDVNVDDTWNSFKSIFLNICEKHAPRRKRRLKNRFCPWVTPDIIEMMYTRDYLHKTAIKSGDTRHWMNYKRVRNKITSSVKSAKRNYFSNQFVEPSQGPKHIWKIIDRLTNKSRDLGPPQDISADDFNEHFSTIGTKTAESLDQVPLQHTWKNPECSTRFSFAEIDVDSVREGLQSLGNESSIDVLGFDAKLLAISATHIAPWLTHMFNMSLQYAYVPSDWKRARVTPLYKGKGSKHEKNNYRPIAVIGHIAKIFERCVQRQLMHYLTVNDFISDDQSAYRRCHSTQTAIIRLNDACIDNLCDKLLTGLCFLDIRKCFDTVNHTVLVNKLKYFGIINKECEWFSNYLSDRNQFVFANGIRSDDAVINIGVPQGSVLGPILFMLFVNDLSQNVFLSSCNMYADDTVIYCNGPNLPDVLNKLQLSVDRASEWYKANSLCLNNDKCNVLLISPRHMQVNNDDFAISLYGKTLNNVEVADYLGIKIDNTLSWDMYIKKLCSSLGCKISKMARLRGVTTSNILNKIYVSAVQPTIDYAICSWGFTSNNNIKRIQRLQNYAARVVTGNFDYINHRGTDLIKSLCWMNVVQRRNYFTLVLMFKCLRGLAPNYLSNEFTMYKDIESVYNLRSSSSENVIVPYVDASVMKCSFSYNGAILWNSLPNDLQVLDDVSDFKRYVKTFVLTNF